MARVAIVMGSDHDLPVVEKAVNCLKELKVEYEVRVISAHRSPEACALFSRSAEENGFGAIIAAAGKAAHLGGVVAAYTPNPVICVPMKTSDLGGLDSLLSMVQMPSGVPVACVAIDGAENAALLAAQILANGDSELRARLKEKRKKALQAIEEADKRVSEQYK